MILQFIADYTLRLWLYMSRRAQCIWKSIYYHFEQLCLLFCEDSYIFQLSSIIRHKFVDWHIDVHLHSPCDFFVCAFICWWINLILNIQHIHNIYDNYYIHNDCWCLLSLLLLSFSSFTNHTRIQLYKRDKELKREEKEKATRASQDCGISSGLAVETPQPRLDPPSPTPALPLPSLFIAMNR